ncbi:unannotated protein [freshwater metagenome]|uniref:Unannotated protein n=1 Tax=freshwater metagenome TaxID=449393 RepID=A0A6J7GPP6_9ZZZZ
MTTTAVAPPSRRLVRRTPGRLVGGVATGLAEHLGVPLTTVRIVLVALTLTGGSGLLAYAAFWLVLPLSREPYEAPPSSRTAQAVVVAGGLGLTLLLLAALGVDRVALPLLAAGAGVALVWRQADDSQRARWRASAPRSGRWPAVAGAVLLAGGIAGFLATRGELREAREGLLSTFLVVGGLVLVGLPWVNRTLVDLREERRERIRVQERAELSAQVHDSVLQTLAMIQRAADDPREVGRLARVQERELRSWLYRPGRPEGAFAAGLERVAAEVEVDLGVPVEVVVVGGDVPADDRLVGLTSAAREAVVNAAKHAGAPVVQVYAEVEEQQVTVFVRDRGKGFDPARVPADRYGLAESVTGRLARLGGTAVVKSAPGEGTDVRLVLPRG